MRERREIFQNISLEKSLLELYAAIYNSVKNYIRYPMWIIADLLSTPLWLIMIMLPIMLFLPKNEWSNPEVYRHFYWGMIFWQIVSTALWSIGFAIRREQQMGTLEQLFLTNVNRIIMFAGRLVVTGIDLILSLIYMAVIMKIFFNVDIIVNNPTLIVIGLVLSTLISLGIGALYGSLVIKLKEIGALSNILQFILIGFSGIFFTIRKLPENLQIISYLLPYTYCIDFVRYAATGCKTLLNPYLELFIIAFLAIAMLSVGYIALIKMEEKSKRTGRIGTY